MSENEIMVIADTLSLNEEQFDALTGYMEQSIQNIQIVDNSIRHATMFLIVLVVVQFYALLSRARKKGGV